MSNSIAIVMPATFPGSVADSHCTNIFLGEITPDLNFTKDHLLNVCYDLEAIFHRNVSRRFDVTGVDWFGVDRDIPVMRLESSWLMHFRLVLEEYLKQENNIRNASEWDYQPHVTLPEGYDVSDLPKYVTLTKPVVWWGDEPWA